MVGQATLFDIAGHRKSPWWDFVYGWPRDIQSWLEDFIAGHHRFDDRGRLLTPAAGIPRRSPLSPFFGALYLTSLDRAFEKQTGVFYVRFMDDITILAQTKSQFVAARKK